MLARDEQEQRRALLMGLATGDLAISLDGIDCQHFLNDWLWLLKEDHEIILITCIGDLILRAKSGSIYWLDTGSGDLEQIASNLAEFKTNMALPENAERWFMALTVYDLISEQGPLKPGECFSYKVAPVLGGSYNLSNFERSELSVHLRLLGQIHRRVSDLALSELPTDLSL